MFRISSTLLILTCLTLNIYSQDSLIDEFPWVSDVYDIEQCIDLSITEYDLGPYSFVLVSDGSLYYQDGTFYCDNNNLDCISVYGLNNALEITSWSCQNDTVDGNIEENDFAFVIENDEARVGDELCLEVTSKGFNDVISFQLGLIQSNDNLRFLRTESSFLDSSNAVYVEEIKEIRALWITTNLENGVIDDETILFEICYEIIDDVNSQTQILFSETYIIELVTQVIEPTFESNTIRDVSLNGGLITIRDASNDEMPDTIAIDTLDMEAMDDNIISSFPINDYPWLASLISNFNCENLELTEYDFGPYSFFFLDDGVLAQMYYQDGTFYCQNSVTLDCKNTYGLTEDKIANEWSCSDGQSDEDGTSDNDSDNDIPDTDVDEDMPDTVAVDDSNSVLFTQFSWLEDIVSCEDGLHSIEEYKSGIFSFIHIRNNAGATLYFQDGTFYCRDSENFDCLATYQLTELINSWTCGEFNKSEVRSGLSKEIDQTINIYPNPSNGIFYIDTEESINYQLFDINGKYIRDIPGGSNTIDLSNQKPAVYLLRITQNAKTITRRLVKTD